jgi:hypothetical protein
MLTQSEGEAGIHFGDIISEVSVHVENIISIKNIDYNEDYSDDVLSYMHSGEALS